MSIGWKCSEDLKSNFKKQMRARLIPHAGHGMPVNFRIGHSYLPVNIKIDMRARRKTSKNFLASIFILFIIFLWTSYFHLAYSITYVIIKSVTFGGI